MNDVANPYSVPKSVVSDVGPGAEAEAVREKHISTEASIRAIGMLYYLGFAGCALAGVLIVAVPSIVGVREGLVTLAFGAALAAVGYGLRALAPWVRIPAIVLSVLGLLAFPFGTLINAYVLYLLFCAKGKYLFTPEYAAIIAVTPQVRYRTSPVVLGAVIVLLVGIVAAVAVPAFVR